MTDKVDLVTLEQNNVDAFLERLRPELYAKFNVSRDEDLPENFSNLREWSLLKLIELNLLDTYQLVYINDLFWGSSGGIVRMLPAGEKIYQAGFRTLSRSFENVHRSLATKPYISGLCIKFQIERAKILNCDKVILSFNEHNKRFLDLLQKYHYKRKFLGVNELMKDFVPTTHPVLFNGVPQWLLEMNLK